MLPTWVTFVDERLFMGESLGGFDNDVISVTHICVGDRAHHYIMESILLLLSLLPLHA